eukprot:44570-Pelagomonas_calceolata.AAC.2
MSQETLQSRHTPPKLFNANLFHNCRGATLHNKPPISARLLKKEKRGQCGDNRIYPTEPILPNVALGHGCKRNGSSGGLAGPGWARMSGGIGAPLSHKSTVFTQKALPGESGPGSRSKMKSNASGSAQLSTKLHLGTTAGRNDTAV